MNNPSDSHVILTKILFMAMGTLALCALGCCIYAFCWPQSDSTDTNPAQSKESLNDEACGTLPPSYEVVCPAPPSYEEACSLGVAGDCIVSMPNAY